MTLDPKISCAPQTHLHERKVGGLGLLDAQQDSLTPGINSFAASTPSLHIQSSGGQVGVRSVMRVPKANGTSANAG